MQGVLEDAFHHISKNLESTPSGRALDSSKGIKNFEELRDWMFKATIKGESDEEAHYLVTRQHDKSTIKAAARRLNNILVGARGVLVVDSAGGDPPQVTSDKTCDPIVLDIDGLESAPQRFVVASVVERIKQHREQHAERRQRYVIVLDELNRFAPRGSRDEVSKLFEHVAAQLRSQGLILFGAQQKASSIAPLVWENAGHKSTRPHRCGRAILRDVAPGTAFSHKSSCREPRSRRKDNTTGRVHLSYACQHSIHPLGNKKG